MLFYVSLNIRLQSMEGGGVSALTLPTWEYTSSGVCGTPGGVILFSFCLRLQNQTLTTSFSSCRLSAREVISWAEGLGHFKKWLSNAPLTLTSMEVRFLRFLPWAAILSMLVGLPVEESASSSHLLSNGFSLHMFLKLSWRASKRQIVVCEKTFPYRVPNAKPTSACVKPSLIRRCLNCLAKCSKSSDVGVSSSECGSWLFTPWCACWWCWCWWWWWWWWLLWSSSGVSQRTRPGCTKLWLPGGLSMPFTVKPPGCEYMRDCCCCWLPVREGMWAAVVLPQAPAWVWWGPKCGGLWCRAVPECKSSLPELFFTSCCCCGLPVIPTGLDDQGDPASAAATAAAAAAAAAWGKDVTHWWAWLSICPPLLAAIAPCMKSLCTILTVGSPLYPPDTEVTAALPCCIPPPESECTIEPDDNKLLGR